MYDTIKVYYPINTEEPNERKRLTSLLDNPKETIDCNSGEVIRESGKVGNMVATIGKNLWLTGSLATFKNGNNNKTLTLSEVRESIEELSDFFGLPLGDATLSRLDIGSTVELNSEVRNYNSKLLSLPRYSRSTVNDEQTVEFGNGRSKLVFYDKKAESGYPYAGNASRIEKRFLHRLSEQLPFQKLKSLGLEEEYLWSVNKWEESYFDVEKARGTIKAIIQQKGKGVAMLKEGTTAAERKVILAMEQYLSNRSKYRRELELERQSKKITPKNYQRTKAMYDAWDCASEEEPLIMELDSKVREEAERLRQQI